jgi:hypothetical protein
VSNSPFLSPTPTLTCATLKRQATSSHKDVLHDHREDCATLKRQSGLVTHGRDLFPSPEWTVRRSNGRNWLVSLKFVAVDPRNSRTRSSRPQSGLATPEWTCNSRTRSFPVPRVDLRPQSGLVTHGRDLSRPQSGHGPPATRWTCNSRTRSFPSPEWTSSHKQSSSLLSPLSPLVTHGRDLSRPQSGPPATSKVRRSSLPSLPSLRLVSLKFVAQVAQDVRRRELGPPSAFSVEKCLSST